MSLPITTPDAECSDLEALVTQILTFLAERLHQYTSIASKYKYFESANTLPDRICEVLVVLLKLDVNSHQHLWLHSAVELTKVAASLASAYRRLGDHKYPRMVYASDTLRPLIQDVFGVVSKFLNNWDMSILRADHGNLPRRDHLHYLDLVQNMCETLIKGQGLVGGGDEVTLLARSTIRFVDAVAATSERYKSLAPSVFPILVSLAHAAFVSGQPEAVVPLMFESALVDDTTATDLLAHLNVDFYDIMDFYRYYGYCLVTLAASGDSINQAYSDAADVFLRVLLKLPNLQASNYFTGGVGQPAPLVPKQYFSDVDREELSFFFLLNSQLHYTSLDQYMRFDNQVRKEMMYFTSLFPSRVSNDLDVLASASQSRSNSTVSVQGVGNRKVVSSPVLSPKALSNILLEGTYMEKRVLVLPYFESLFHRHPNISIKPLVKTVQLFNMRGAPSGTAYTAKITNDNVLHYARNIDNESDPGKALFVHAIDKSVRLLELLSILHLSDSVGLSSDPDELISTVFNTGHTYSDVARVKNLTKLENGKLLRFYALQLEEELIASQMAILQRTKTLEGCVRKLA